MPRSLVGIYQRFEEFVGSICRKETERGGSTHQVILGFADDVQLLDVHSETSQSLLQQSNKKTWRDISIRTAAQRRRAIPCLQLFAAVPSLQFTQLSSQFQVKL
jgi:hypothetical protein